MQHRPRPPDRSARYCPYSQCTSGATNTTCRRKNSSSPFIVPTLRQTACRQIQVMKYGTSGATGLFLWRLDISPFNQPAVSILGVAALIDRLQKSVIIFGGAFSNTLSLMGNPLEKGDIGISGQSLYHKPRTAPGRHHIVSAAAGHIHSGNRFGPPGDTPAGRS